MPTLVGYTGPDSVVQRYAETIKQLSFDRTKQQFELLRHFLPVLHDIVLRDEGVEAVTDACHALDHLLDAEDPPTVDALIDGDILPALVSRLRDPKVTIIQNTLITLTTFAECCDSAQVLELEIAIEHLQRLLMSANKKLLAQAAICIYNICEGGDQSVQQILDFAPDLFSRLAELAEYGGDSQAQVQVAAKHAAMGLLKASERANKEQLTVFLQKHQMYSEAFKLLDGYSEHFDVQVIAIKAISNIIFKVEAIARFQADQERRVKEFHAEDGWAVIKALAAEGRSGSSNDNGRGGGGGADGGERAESAREVKDAAARLLVHARGLGLTD